MSKPLSILPTVVAMSACAALVCAEETSPTVRTTMEPAPAAEKKVESATKPVDVNSGPKLAAASTPGSSAAAANAAASSEITGEATPKPKKRGMFDWMFSGKKKKVTPAPTATVSPETKATPSPTPHRATHKPTGTPAPESENEAAKPAKATPTPKPEKSEKPAATPKPEKEKATPTPKPEKATPTPKPEKATPTPKPEKATPTPKPEKTTGSTPAPAATPAATPAGKKGKKQPATPAPAANASNLPPEPGADADPEAKEKYRFEVAKTKAENDEHIKSLKAKADEATTEADSKAALRTYNKALFEKVKKIDPSVSEWSDRMEAAILKRLNE